MKKEDNTNIIKEKRERETHTHSEICGPYTPGASLPRICTRREAASKGKVSDRCSQP